MYRPAFRRNEFLRAWRRKQFEGFAYVPCRYCGASLKFDEATVDHVKPLARGGLDVPENFAIACLPCNQKKGSATNVELDDVPLSKPHSFAAEFELAKAQRDQRGTSGPTRWRR